MKTLFVLIWKFVYLADQKRACDVRVIRMIHDDE